MRIDLLCPILVLVICACTPRNKQTDVDSSRIEQASHVTKVEIQALERTDFPVQLLSNGHIYAARKAVLSFGATGRIAEAPVRNGQRIGRDGVIASLDRPDLRLAEESARISLKKAEIDLFDILAGQGYASGDTTLVPQESLSIAKIRSGYSAARNELFRARQALDGTVLKAPFPGRVADISLYPHQLVGTDPYCTLLDDSWMSVVFTVMESEYAFISKGLSVTVIPFAEERLSYRGTIEEINPSVDRNGQVVVRAKVRNDGALLDGMNVHVVVEKMIPNCLVVPRGAVVIRDNLDVLFTYTNDGKAHWTYVNILASNGSSHVVEANAERGSSLSPGDYVIVSGNLNLADGSSVSLQ